MMAIHCVTRHGLTRNAAILAALAVIASTMVAVPASADEIRDRQYWLAQYGFTTAWATTRGEGITVAVIDTGIDSSQPDLVGAVSGGTDVSGLGAANGQTPVGLNPEHGTMVASLLAGRGHGSGSGVLGVAPAAKLLAVSVGLGVGSASSDDQIASAVRWSVDHGANIINMSLVRNTLDWPTSWDSAFLYAMQHNVIVVAAAGNRGSGTTEVGAPATIPGVVVVAGVSRAGKASIDASSQGITLSVAAPSENLVGAVPGGGYAEWAGTSGACPIVAGLLALIMAAHPKLSAGNVINRMTATATKAGTSIQYGSGLINAAAAVTAAVPSVSYEPAKELEDWIRLNRRAEMSTAPKPTSTGAQASTVPKAVPDSRAFLTVSPFGRVLPTMSSLRNEGIPLLVFLVFGALFAIFLVRMRRQSVNSQRSDRSRRK